MQEHAHTHRSTTNTTPPPPPNSPLPPLLLNSQHAAQNLQARGSAEHRLGHPSDVAAATQHDAALRQAGAASEADEEAVFVRVFKVKSGKGVGKVQRRKERTLD